MGKKDLVSINYVNSRNEMKKKSFVGIMKVAQFIRFHKDKLFVL